MSYKKLVSLLAVSTFALAACGADEEPTTDDTEQTEDVETEDETDETEGSNSSSLIEDAKNNAGDAFPEYGLTVTGLWTVDGYQVEYPAGEAATIPASIITEAEGYNVYLLEDGVITDVVSDEPAVEFTVEEPSADTEYVVGVSPDELGEAGDEVAEDDFYRSEKVVLVEAAAEEEAVEE